MKVQIKITPLLFIFSMVLLLGSPIFAQMDIEKFQGGSFELTPEQEQLGAKPRLADVFIKNHPRTTSESLGFPPCAWMTYLSVDPVPEPQVSKWYNIFGGSIDLIDSNLSTIDASDGQNCVDLIGSPGLGALNQNIMTESGRSYIFSFDITSNQENFQTDVPRRFSVFWDSQFVLNSVTAPNQNIYDRFTFVQTADAAATRVGFAAVQTAQDENFFGAVLDNVSAIEIRAVDDATNLDENFEFSSFRLNVLENDSGITEVIAAEVVGCSDNLTMDQCGSVIQDGFPEGQVFWDSAGPDPLAFDFLSSGETATIEIEYQTQTVVDEGRNGQDGPSNPVLDTGTWIITILGTNDPPIANDDSATTTLNFPIIIDVGGNDFDIDGTADAEPLIVNDPLNGNAVANPNGTITYTPDLNFSGTDLLTYRARDNSGQLSENVATVIIEVCLGDVNQDGAVNLLDVDPFITVLSSGTFQIEADLNRDGFVNLLDVAPFVEKLTGG